MNRQVIVVVDNRDHDEPIQSEFKGSGFKFTEVDPHESVNIVPEFFDDSAIIVHLRQKLMELENRVEMLEKDRREEVRPMRLRRKANEIRKNFQCPHKSCLKLYGSDTSLKNHLKIKHRERA